VKDTSVSHPSQPHLVRGIGPLQATALNVTMIVGAGVFATIPDMVDKLPGPYALWGWIAAGALILIDGLIWSELGAALPGSGGSYHFLLECFGRERWGRLMAFMFIWQFLISGPLELGSGLVAIAQFATYLSPRFQEFNSAHTLKLEIWHDQDLSVSFGPARVVGLTCGICVILLLFRNIKSLGKLTVTFWLGVLAAIAWILIEGWTRFDPSTAFDYSGDAAKMPVDFSWKLGPVMVLAMYSYLGYYNVCYIGDEVRDPARTIPRSICCSAVIVCVLFVGLHLAMLGTVSWSDMLAKKKLLEAPEVGGTYSLPAEFMQQIHGSWAASLITVLLIWSCFGSAFAGLLGYSRIPYGAARNGHFFSIFKAVHPVHQIPHVSLLLVGAMMLFWGFFDLQNVINALITTRIIEQFIGQIVGVVLLRHYRPDVYRPYKMVLYPLPCLLALVGWLYLYLSAGLLYISLGIGTLAAGLIVFLVWSRHTGAWPFAPDSSSSQGVVP
jgi:amino acid transporter